KMLSTLHSCSNLGVRNDLELFSLPSTQFSHEGEDFIQFHPAALKPGESDFLEFNIPNSSESYLDPSSIFLQIRGKITRLDGKNTLALPANKDDWLKGTGEKPDQVYPVENFANSLFRFCHVYLN